MQSAPASIKDLAASFVAIFPAIICVVFESFFILLTICGTWEECPWAVSTTRRSTPASINASALSKPLSPTDVAAATLNLPFLSLQAVG